MTKTLDFGILKTAVAAQFERLQKHSPFRVALPVSPSGEEIGKEELYALYLSSFPEGTNPMFRERTEHDCSCCKSFIRSVGNVVAVIDGKLESVWDVKTPKEPAYQVVADALSAFIKDYSIGDVFLHFENLAGADKTFEQLLENGKPTGGVTTWRHFFANIKPEFVKKNADIAPYLGEKRMTQEVFVRGLQTISLESIDSVLELIAQNSLYKGEENKFVLNEFRKQIVAYQATTTTRQKEIFGWIHGLALSPSVSRIRNTSIGTLLVDLSEGKDLDGAVKSFEAKVAPANYKRPTALVTKAMIEKAKETLAELGLLSALERRYATLGDITINNILFADRTAKPKLSGNVFDDLAAATSSKVKVLDKVEEVTIDKFISDILPRVESIEVLLENHHAGNMVSLVAPVDPTAGGLFKWSNNFSWSYVGEVTDSIKERVKQAGGNVSGDLCCRLSWSNTDDLDLHMTEPDGNEINFHQRGPSKNGGRLDVDMNNGFQGSLTRQPVENIFYPKQSTMRDGIYTLYVNNYYKRESRDVGFEVEIDWLGVIHRFAYPQAVANKGNVIVAAMNYSRKDGITFTKSLPSSTAVRNVWALPTQTFHKVNALMMSPNFWDGQQGIGNKHFLFMLQGAVNDSTARGFYNEFLRADLDKHRKVFEMVGSKMLLNKDNEQLSGLGFSSTQRNNLTCRVKGSFTRTLKVTF